MDRRSVSWSDFHPVKSAVETHIAEDAVKWESFEELRTEFKELRTVVVRCTGAIALLLVLNENNLLKFKPLLTAAEAQIEDGRAVKTHS